MDRPLEVIIFDKELGLDNIINISTGRLTGITLQLPNGNLLKIRPAAESTMFASIGNPYLILEIEKKEEN